MTTSNDDPHIVAFTTIEGGFWMPWKPQWKAPPESVLDHKTMEIQTVNAVMGEPPDNPGLGYTLLARLHVGEQKYLDPLTTGSMRENEHPNIPWFTVPAFADVEQQVWVHALKFSDGREWDALNGWREQESWTSGRLGTSG